MKPPPRTSKRKRSYYQDEEDMGRIIETAEADPVQSPVKAAKNRSSAQDTASDISGLTSAEGVITVASKTGFDGDETKIDRQNGSPSGLYYSHRKRSIGNMLSRILEAKYRTAEIATAYRNAVEVLVEIADRQRYRVYAAPHVGFGGPNTFRGPYSHLTATGHTFPTPFSTSGPSTYVTPYANPPPADGINEISQSDQQMTPAKSSEVHEEAREPQYTTIEADTASENANDDVEKLKESMMNEEEDSMSVGQLDGFLALANGGVLPGQKADPNDSDNPASQHTNDLTSFAPPSPADTIDEALCRPDEDIQALVDAIAEDLMNSQEPLHSAPPSNPYAPFYSSLNGKQLGIELKRLVAVVPLEVNTIMPSEQSQAARLFYTHLAGCARTRNANIVSPTHAPAVGSMNQMGFAGYPPPLPPPQPPKGYMVVPTQWPNNFAYLQPGPPQIPSPMFVPRGNVIAPPVMRNPDEERRVAGFGFPPVPSPPQRKRRLVAYRGKRKQMGQ